MREDIAQLLAGAGAPRNRGQFDSGVLAEQSRQLDTGVTGNIENPDACFYHYNPLKFLFDKEYNTSSLVFEG